MVDVYADDPNAAFIAIDYGAENTRSDVEAWIEDYGWSFPVGVNDEENEIYHLYGYATRGYDTFFVIDSEGLISFIEPGYNSTQDFPKIRQAIDAALSKVDTVPTTWGRIKRLYP